MKRFTALIAAALIALAPYARADGWPEGLSAAKPFSYVDECDLSARVGYMMTMPENATSAPCGIDSLTIYLPREDLTAMRGVLTVNDFSGEVYAECDLSTAEIAPMSRADLSFYGWGGGTAITLKLDRALEGGKVYSVNIPAGAFELSGLNVESAALDGVKQWTFATLNYGIWARTENFTGEAHVGDSVSARAILGDAASARLVIDSPMTASSEAGDFTSDGDFTVTFTSEGDAAYTLEFYDAAGMLIGAVSDSIAVK